MTWRKAVDNLHGTNWDSRVLDYFKGSLQHVKFPPENSVNELKLGRYGIKYNVECGVHRVIAGKAWLAHQFGGNAYFSNCLVRSHVINTEVRSFLKEHGQFGLLIYKTSLHPMDKIFINNAVPRYLIASCKFPYKMYLLTEDVCEISRFNRLNPLNWLKILCGTSITEKIAIAHLRHNTSKISRRRLISFRVILDPRLHALVFKPPKTALGGFFALSGCLLRIVSNPGV